MVNFVQFKGRKGIIALMNKKEIVTLFKIILFIWINWKTNNL